MSIATLKRKTAAKYNNSSVNSTNGFSLNGGHRNQGYIGQTSLSRSLPRTLMKGNTARGHGGCCGKYPTGPIISSAVKSTEDSTVIKSSSLSNKGMIATHYRWVLRPQPFSVVKPDTNVHQNTQQQYVEYVRRRALVDMTGPCAITTKHVNTTCPNVSKPTPASACAAAEEFTQGPAKHIFMKSSDYTESLVKPCVESDPSPFYIQKPTRRTPFACNTVV